MKNRILKSIAAALAPCTAMLAFTACSGSGDTSGTAEGTGEATVDTTEAEPARFRCRSELLTMSRRSARGNSRSRNRGSAVKRISDM